MQSKDLKAIIKNAKMRKETSLDLSDQGIERLPRDLWSLKDLTSLDLSGNQLTAVPPEIAALTGLTTLDLSGNQLTAVPPEIAALTGLTTLNLFGNQLTAVPPEIAALTGLTTLYLSGNQLTAVPPEIAALTGLTTLYLSGNQLTAVPPEIAALTGLTTLNLSVNQLTAVPPEIAALTGLTTLDLSHNQLTAVPPEIAALTGLTTLNLSVNQLTAVPPEIAALTGLTTLDLSGNQLTAVPPEIAALTGLTTLDLSGNQLTAVPPEIAALTGLTTLDLSHNQLTAVPPEIAALTGLTTLNLSGNQLTAVPPEIAALTGLTTLDLSHNQLTAVPPEIAALTGLTTLYLSGNQLTAVPPEIAALTGLTTLDLSGNPRLTDPPPDVVEQGTKAILAYLAANLEGEHVEEWLSKLLVVGEAGVGKTQTLRSLRGEIFEEQSPPTEGIDIRDLEIPHPTRQGVTMRFKTWDFAGQEINHATHQFFLTNRSLFLLVWNGRQNYAQGRIEYWLDTIHARAPESPILLVATHIDFCTPDIPLSEMRRKYPQIVGQCEISNEKKTGIEGLRDAIAAIAADREKLPLMGERWPSRWLDAANEVRALPENHITPARLWDVMARRKVSGKAAETLAVWLHELGDILYFKDEEDLKDIVLLKTRLVTEAISRVLKSEEVKGNFALLNRDEMESIWADIEPFLRNHLVNLMDQFDLSYRTKENREISLVVPLLPSDPPDYDEDWEVIRRKERCQEISMIFDLKANLPAGVPSWFIARQHRFTTHTHWRRGALFADGADREHLGLIQAFEHERYLRLAVRGPFPQTFFALLRDGLETTLARFPGLKIERRVPCTGHDGQPCDHQFDLKHLMTATEKNVMEVQCPASLEMVSVSELLFGVPWRLPDIVRHYEEATERRHEEILAGMGDLRTLGGVTLVEVRELRALVEREFTRQFRRDQQFEESHCPNVFSLRPKGGTRWPQKLVGQALELQLYCQEPGHWHPAGDPYTLPTSPRWLQALAPYVRPLVKAMKYAAPLLAPGLGHLLPDVAKVMKDDLELMKALVEKLPEIEDDLGAKHPGLLRADDLGRRIDGAPLREIRVLLDEIDKNHVWGGLRKKHTPEGDYLWLCATHFAEYAR